MVQTRARLTTMAVVVAAMTVGCALSGGQRGSISDAARKLDDEASKIKAIAYEEDFVDARLVYQALPLNAHERPALRRKMLAYLLGPIARIDPALMRRQTDGLATVDDLDRIVDSLRDALDLFAPTELWAKAGLRLPAEEQGLLTSAARTVVTIYSPRGTETAVAMGLCVLATLEPQNHEWTERLDQLLPWVQAGADLSLGSPGPRSSPTPVEVLESVATTWPAPPVIDRLTNTYFDRQKKLSAALRRPLGLNSPRGGLGDLFADGETVQATALDLASLHLRAGQLPLTATVLERVANKPGDDPDLRQLVAATTRTNAAAADYLALARRFLPRLELLGGTSNDRVDPFAATQVLDSGMQRFPRDTTLLILASRVARFVPATYLSLRYLEEAQTLLENAHASADDLADLSAELLDLSFTRLRVRIDPDRIEPAAREADLLHRRFAESRKRFGEGRFKLRDAEIDFELGRGLVDAGLIDRAESLFTRARMAGEPNAEITLQLANLALKRGDAGRAAQILREAFDRQLAQAPAQETIPYVESQAKLARALGNAYEVTGNLDQAKKAWKQSLQGWERLMGEQLRRKNTAASSEATFEVGRLYYLTSRREEGAQKFLEAIEQNESRDQGYIDALAFLVQHGETDAAREIYRRALSKPNRVVSEYVKIYSSLWILDLTRRSGKGPDTNAEAYLRSVSSRPMVLRPPRAAAWYLPLARYAVGGLSYGQLAAMADTTGKRAELYFYEAMRRLADGHSDDAHALWNKVVETMMFSFFEFEMATRYLRTGAPTEARPDKAADTETI